MNNLTSKVNSQLSKTANRLRKVKVTRECMNLFAGFVGISLDFYKAYMILTASHKSSSSSGH